jgi:hypothetical protein
VQQVGAQQAAFSILSVAGIATSVPYTVLSPVVKNVSHWMPWGSSIQFF